LNCIYMWVCVCVHTAVIYIIVMLATCWKLKNYSERHSFAFAALKKITQTRGFISSFFFHFLSFFLFYPDRRRQDRYQMFFQTSRLFIRLFWKRLAFRIIHFPTDKIIKKCQVPFPPRHPRRIYCIIKCRMFPYDFMK